MMGGEIQVESEVGRGSTFWFTARFDRAPDEEGQNLVAGSDTVAAGDKLPAERAASTLPGVPLPPLSILLVEDSVVNQKLAVGLLQRRGHTVLVTNHGAEAVEALKTADVDLVLMDVQMPHMDGFEATSIIRAREKETGKHVPIIAMTAHALKGDRQRCLEAGMDDYVAKPIRAKKLFETIGSVMGVFRGSREDPPGPDSAGDGGVDWSEALRSVGGDQKLLGEIVKDVLEETPRLMVAVREAVAQRSSSGLRAAAHKLKGTVRYFGVTQAFTNARQLEEMGEQGNLEGVETTLATLEKEIDRLAAILAKNPPQETTAPDS
jgi:CheY-like chemotaxis protein